MKMLTSNFAKRLISGLLYAFLVLFCTSGNSWFLWGLMLSFLIVCAFEFIRLVELEDWLYRILFFLALGAVFYFFSKPFLQGANRLVFMPINLLPGIMFLLLGITIFRFTTELETEFGKFTLGTIYLSAFAVALSLVGFEYDKGAIVISKEVFFIFILIFISDSCAYLVGKQFGKRKLAPKISPGKTWEGFLGSFFGVLIAGIIVHFYFSENLQGNWVIIAAIVSITATFGDLLESKLKRSFRKKDSSNWFPGHGGFLDRLDSFVFSIPFVHLYFIIDSII